MDGQFTKTLSKITFQLFLFLGIFAHTWWKLGDTEYIPMSFLIIQSLLVYLIVTAVLQTIVRTIQEHRSLLRGILALMYGASLVIYFFVPQLVYGFVFTSSGTAESNTPFNNWILVITTITGLVSAVSGAYSQVTSRKKAMAEIELEKQKLALEREKLELEKLKNKPKRKSK